MAEKLDLDAEATGLGPVALAEVIPAPIAGASLASLIDAKSPSKQAIVVQGVDDHQVTVAPPKDPMESAHQRWLEKARTLFGMTLFVVAVVIACVMVFFQSNADIQKIGAGIIVAALSAAAGFMARGSK